MTPANARGNQGRFLPGKSGNPGGKPKGARNRTTLAMEQLLDADAKRLTQTAISAALAGDMVALRLCLDRLIPPRRERPLPPIALPKIAPENVGALARAVLEAAASGQLTAGEAAAFGAILDGYRRSVELDEIGGRLAALEARIGGDSSLD